MDLDGTTGTVAAESSSGPGGSSEGEGSTGPGDTAGPTTVEPTGSAGDCLAVEACVSAAPQGWQGPVATIERATLDTLPACQDEYAERVVQTFDQLDGSPASCLGCECGPGTGVECTTPEVRFYNSSACGMFGTVASSEYTMEAAGVCTVFAASAGNFGAEADEIVPVEGTGSCDPLAVTPELPEPIWGTIRRACAPEVEGTNCGDGRVCAVTPTAPFDPDLCIWTEGDMPCPDGDYTERSVYFQGVDDQRSCSACECGPTQGGDCDAEIMLSHVASCVDDYVTIPNFENNCTFLNGDPPDSGLLIVDGVDDVTCEASGGAVTGEAIPNQPVTFCCTGSG